MISYLCSYCGKGIPAHKFINYKWLVDLLYAIKYLMFDYFQKQ